ncbi:MAG: signal recognition particle-docking protein FtsY [Thermodesulfobacteriota bacterium]
MLGWFKKKLGAKKEEADQAPAQPAEAAVALPEEAPPTPVPSPVAEPGPPPAAPGAAGEEGGGDRKSLFQRLAQRLSKTRQTLISRIDGVFAGRKKIDAELFDDLEEILITADLGVRTAQDLLDGARKRVQRDKLSDPTALKEVLKELLLGYLVKADRASELAMPAEGPLVIMVLGVNGVGKTTTIGKLANKFKQAGHRVLLVAADTFRAAAIDQLKVWAERVGVEICAQKQGADPSSVVFDALDYARPRDFDVIIVDTAGRLHTKVNLMEELKKLKRVAAGKIPGAPHEVLLVLDATTGQNGIAQARQFNEAVDITGLALTKLDGTAKGGIVVNICHEFDIPIRFIGIGEKMDDLRDFDAREFTAALFAGNGAEAADAHG